LSGLSGTTDKAKQKRPTGREVLNGVVTECEQVVRDRDIVGYLYDPVSGNFVGGDGRIQISDGDLRALSATLGREVTYTAVTPGSGRRIAFSNVPPIGRRPQPR
jgi:hypothetical protein